MRLIYDTSHAFRKVVKYRREQSKSNNFQPVHLQEFHPTVHFAGGWPDMRAERICTLMPVKSKSDQDTGTGTVINLA